MKPFYSSFCRIVLIVILLFLSGCGWDYMFFGKGFEGSEAYWKWRREQESYFVPYYGKTSAEIESIFGEPDFKHKDDYVAPPTPKFPQGWDAQWVYKHLPQVEAEYLYFYFKDDKLVKVDA